jgi:hypothetical protein
MIRMKMQAWKIMFLFLIASPVVLHAQGFGTFQKKVVTINRLLPPTVNLKGKRIRVEATADSVQKDGEQLRSLLKTKLVTLIQKDPRFILNETSPETILKFSITNFYTEQVTSGTGANRTVANRGKIEVAYQAIDVATGSALDSEILMQTAGYDPGQIGLLDALHMNKKKQAAEASLNETRDQLVSGIVDSMARRIAPLDQPFEAPLPGGKLEPLSSLALSGRWGALEEQAEKMDKLPKPNDDAYRLYLVALAKEAEAYDLTREANERDLGKRTDISPAKAEAEFQKAQNNLDEAGTIYKQIITANAKEKDFRAGDTRTEEALAIYAKIERFKAENAKAMAAKAAETGRAGNAAPNHPDTVASKRSPLEQVLYFCNQGVAVESIKEYIESPDFTADAKATNYKFSFANDSIRLNDACKQNAAVLQRLIRTHLTQGTGPAHR